jgi:hypothetical protein
MRSSQVERTAPVDLRCSPSEDWKEFVATIQSQFPVDRGEVIVHCTHGKTEVISDLAAETSLPN